MFLKMLIAEGFLTIYALIAVYFMQQRTKMLWYIFDLPSLFLLCYYISLFLYLHLPMLVVLLLNVSVICQYILLYAAPYFIEDFVWCSYWHSAKQFYFSLYPLIEVLFLCFAQVLGIKVCQLYARQAQDLEQIDIQS